MVFVLKRFVLSCPFFTQPFLFVAVLFPPVKKVIFFSLLFFRLSAQSALRVAATLLVVAFVGSRRCEVQVAEQVPLLSEATVFVL